MRAADLVLLLPEGSNEAEMKDIIQLMTFPQDRLLREMLRNLLL